jgi:hypothetical protein
MAIAELALIVALFGAMAVMFGAQERGEERRVLAWAEETLARLAAQQREAGAEAGVPPAAAADDDVEAPAAPPSRLVGAA